jgi:hypothetical protein
MQNGGVPGALPCCDRKERPGLNAISRDRRHAVAKHVCRLRLVVPKALLDRMRFDPRRGWATDGPERLGLLIDDLDTPTRAAGAAADGRTPPPGDVDQDVAAAARRWLPGRLSLLQPLFEPVHALAWVRPKTPISLVNQVRVKPHEAKPVREGLDVERRHVAPGLGAHRDGRVHVKAASAWISPELCRWRVEQNRPDR